MNFQLNNYILDLTKKIIKHIKKEVIMNKKIVLLTAFILIFTSLNVFAVAPNQLQPINSNEQKVSVSGLDKNADYYPNANIKSAIAKYKIGNYVGCLQELFSLTKRQPTNAVAYYYMAMAYTHVDMQNEAIEAYEKVIALKPNSYISDFAEKGRDCLTNGPKCKPTQITGEMDELDKFIQSPYGNGLSPELNNEIKQKQLNNIKETINKKDDLENSDIQKIKEFDLQQDNQSTIEVNEKIAMASDAEILQAVKTLKDAGLNITIQENPYTQFNQYQDPRMTEMSMLLGGNNNNNNNMMNMLPMLMNKAQNGENIDPRFMQAMMMNSMMSDLDFNNNNRY